jgi:hypothetical protein
MLEIIGSLISYVCQLAIIAFVVKEFLLWLQPQQSSQTLSVSSPNGNSSSIGGLDIGSMLQGAVKGLAQELGKAGMGPPKAQQDALADATVKIHDE